MGYNQEQKRGCARCDWGQLDMKLESIVSGLVTSTKVVYICDICKSEYEERIKTITQESQS